jgi:methylenetetrahydrofolate reductase (NADPH)
VAGADFAITQLFFHADDYLGFVERARAAGVTMPIVPGIMPVTTPGRLRRIAELSGQDAPADLLASLESAPDDDERFRIGVAHASDLARAVIVGGAPSLHLYTFNQHPAALAVLRECGLVPSPSIKEFA